jgi:Caudovirus prohead serine protease
MSHIGYVTKAVQTAKGLEVEYKLDIDTNPKAAQIFRLLKERRVTEHSFAYDVLDERRAEDGANELLELDLIEVGPALKGANPATRTNWAKDCTSTTSNSATSYTFSTVPPVDPSRDPNAVLDELSQLDISPARKTADAGVAAQVGALLATVHAEAVTERARQAEWDARQDEVVAREIPNQMFEITAEPEPTGEPEVHQDVVEMTEPERYVGNPDHPSQ